MWNNSQQGQRRLEHADWPLRLAGPPRCLQMLADHPEGCLLTHLVAQGSRAGQQGASLISCLVDKDPISSSKQPAMASLFKQFGVNTSSSTDLVVQVVEEAGEGHVPQENLLANLTDGTFVGCPPLAALHDNSQGDAEHQRRDGDQAKQVHAINLQGRDGETASALLAAHTVQCDASLHKRRCCLQQTLYSDASLLQPPSSGREAASVLPAGAMMRREAWASARQCLGRVNTHLQQENGIGTSSKSEGCTSVASKAVQHQTYCSPPLQGSQQQPKHASKSRTYSAVHPLDLHRRPCHP